MLLVESEDVATVPRLEELAEDDGCLEPVDDDEPMRHMLGREQGVDGLRARKRCRRVR